MAQENYVEGCSMERPPSLEPNGFCFWRGHFETYVNSNDIDLWQVIQNDDFYYVVEDSKNKLIKETPYELLEDDQKKKHGKKNEAMMTLYNALPRKEYERVFIVKPPRRFGIHSSSLTKAIYKSRIARFIFSLKNRRSSQSRMKKLLIAALQDSMLLVKLTTIEEAKDLATLPLDELVRNLKVYEIILEKDGVVSKTITKVKVKSLALKANVTREQTSDDSDSQRGSDVDVDEEEEVEAFNLLARNFHKFFCKGNQLGR
nr:hypothetical protein [Tanacetum cinerariifolium]